MRSETHTENCSDCNSIFRLISKLLAQIASTFSGIYFSSQYFQPGSLLDRQNGCRNSGNLKMHQVRLNDVNSSLQLRHHGQPTSDTKLIQRKFFYDRSKIKAGLQQRHAADVNWDAIVTLLLGNIPYDKIINPFTPCFARNNNKNNNNNYNNNIDSKKISFP